MVSLNSRRTVTKNVLVPLLPGFHWMVVRLTKKLHVNEHPISVSLQWMQAIVIIMLTRGGSVGHHCAEGCCSIVACP